MKILNYETLLKSKKKHFKDKCKYLIIFFVVYFYFIYNNNPSNNHKYLKSNLIKENFFIIDSNNLGSVQSHMYGFWVSKGGILTDNYYKKIGNYSDPDPEGVYIMIRKIKNKIEIRQDFYGGIGLFLYEKKDIGYFAISNSFLLLEEYLIGKQNFSLNKDFADDFIIEGLCTPSINETLVKEITKMPSNVFITINIDKKSFKFYYIDYEENTIPLDSEEGLTIIDNWADKWGYIIRSLKKQTDNIYSDLSGGYDTRMVLALLLNSGININNILIFSSNDNLHVHEEDFKIANNISSKFGFKLNDFKLDDRGILFNIKDSLFCSLYSKLGFHKEFYFQKKFFLKPRFHFTGGGGEIIRGYPGKSIKKYMETLSYNSWKIKDYQKEFHDATFRLCNRSIQLLKKKKSYNNDFEIASDLYYKGRTRAHYGTSAYENFIANIFCIQPLLDSNLKKIKLDIKDNLVLDISAYIYVRFAYDLINFPFEGKRILFRESVKKAENFNKKFGYYKIKYNFKQKFFIDKKRKSPVSFSRNLKNNEDAQKYIMRLVDLNKIYYYIHKLYKDSVYKWSIEFKNKTKYHPLRHIYSLLAIAKTLEDLTKNHNKIGLDQNTNEGQIRQCLFD